MRIVGPRPPAMGSDDFAAAGQGRFAGFVLRPAAEPLPRDHPLLAAGQLNRCWEPGCAAREPDRIVASWGMTVQEDGDVVVPRGTYDLHLIAEAPTRLTLHLEIGRASCRARV